MRSIVIGLDGGTWDVIKPWADEGTLPNIKKLVEKGSWSILESTIPYYTATAWTSFSTGKTPIEHGIFDFVKIDKNYEYKLVTSKDIKADLYYEILSDYGLRSIIINLPLAFPPQKKFNGIMLAGFTSKSKEKIFPMEYAEKYSNLLQDYRTFPRQNIQNPVRYIEDVLELEKSRFEIAKVLFENEKWNHFFILFSGTDWIGHKAMGYLHGDNKVNDAIKRFYNKIDGFVGWFLERVEKDDLFMIISDHGMAEIKKSLFVNTILYRNNLLKVKLAEEKNPFFDLAQEVGGVNKRTIKNEFIIELIDLLLRNKISKRIVEFLYKALQDKFNLKLTVKQYVPDKENSTAFLTTNTSYGIYINSKDKFAGGKVSEDEYPLIMNELSKLMESLKNKGIIKDYFQNKQQDYSPDILFITQDGIALLSTINDDFIKDENNKAGCHKREGIFILYNESAKHDELENRRLSDVVNIILDFHKVQHSRKNNIRKIISDLKSKGRI